MKRYLAAILVLQGLVQLSLQSTDDGIPPDLVISVANVDLNEKEACRTQLGGGAVLSCSDADGDAVRAYLADISPSSGCGLGCLQLLPCGGDDYCLWFLASQGSLDYSTSSVYTLTVGCTDDVETVVTQDMTVTVLPNEAPVFSPTTDTLAQHGQKTTHNERVDLYVAPATDAEGDPMYFSVATDPTTDLIEIEYSSGQLKAAHDWKMYCEDSMEASVYVRDAYHTNVGPFILDITVDNYNTLPTVTNLDTTVTIDENEAVDKRVIEFDVIDTKNTDLTYNQRATTDAGMEAYGMREPSLRTLIELDYEREDTRSVKLYFDLYDEYCKSETYSLTVEVNDLPEDPKITHEDQLIFVDEGWVNTPNNVFVLDEDLDETHTWSREDSTDDLFDVDPETGNFISYDEIILNSRTYKDYNVRTRVTDKDGLRSAILYGRVRVFDVNNFAPYFTNANNPMTLSAHECLTAGTVIGNLRGADIDSEYNLNNWIYFGGGGGKFAVAANGWIVLTEPCSNGETYSGAASIHDQGINPGPLTGDDLDILLICGPCPTGGATTTPATNSTSTAAPATTTESGGGGSSTESLLIWIAPALLLAACWLALTVCLIQRFAKTPCIKCCQPKPKPVRVSPEPPKVSQPPPKSKPPPPPPPAKPKAPMPPPPPPKPETPPGPPYLLNFWSLAYTNQDQQQPTSKTNNPKAIEEMPVGEANAEPPENLRLGQSQNGGAMPRFLAGNVPPAASGPAAPPPPPPKKSFCAIL